MTNDSRTTGVLTEKWIRCGGPAIVKRPTALPVPTDRESWMAVSEIPVMMQLRNRSTLDGNLTWPQLLAHQWARFGRDGDREDYQKTLFERVGMMRRAVLIAAQTLNNYWCDRAVDGLVLACMQLSWCWPAHDTLSRGQAVPNPQTPFLDLGASEMAADLAWADAAMGPLLDQRWPGLRKLVKDQVMSRVIMPFVERRDWWWISGNGQVNNWNPWIHANVIAAALQFVDDPELRQRVISLAIEGLDIFVDDMPDDGACAEGYNYWWEGIGRLFDVLGLLKTITRGAFDPGDLTVLQNTIGYPCSMYLGESTPWRHWCVNFGDAQALMGDEPWHSLYAAAKLVPTSQYARLALELAIDNLDLEERLFTPAQNLWRMLVPLFDKEWRDGRLPSELDQGVIQSTDYWASTQQMVAREPHLTVAARAGHNGATHTHLDAGAFTMALDNVPFLVDAGRPTYTKATFGPERNELWMINSSWHNVPEIDGIGQSAGEEFAATDVVFENNELTFDLGGAYEIPGLRWQRRIGLGDAQAYVDDTWECGDLPVQWHVVVAGGVAKSKDGRTVVKTLGGGRAVLTTEPAIDPTMTVRPLHDPLLADSWGKALRRLEFDVSGLSHFRLTVTYER